MANRYFTIANLLLVAAVVYFAVSIFYAIMASHLEIGPPAVPAGRSQMVAATADTASSLGDYQVIVERNLFNSSRQALGGPEQAGPTAVDLDKLKQTELKLKLVGTTAGQVEAAPAAFIEDSKTREHRMYRTGDAVQNAIIKMILREKVVLTVDGKDEVLIQEEPGVVKGPAPPAARADTGGAPKTASAEPIQQVSVPEEQLGKAMENLSELMNQATFRPHIEDGKPAGISITGIKPNAIFRKLRLRNGDVITGVNGQPIESVEDAMRAFPTLSADAPIQVKIKRRGREETLEYKIE